MKLIARSLTLTALLGIAASAHAQLAFDTILGSSTFADFTGTAGYTFSVLSPITVTELNVYAGFGLVSQEIPVGIWNSTNTLITSSIISTTTPGTITPSANGGNYFGALTDPVNLAAGDYTIGAYYGDVLDTAATFGVLLFDPRVSYGSAAVINGTSLQQPEAVQAGAALFGPSFKIAPVPAPSSFAVFAGLSGIGGLMLRRRKK